MKTLFIGVLCLAVLAGCYPHIKWARENNIVYEVVPIADKNLLPGGHMDKAWGGYFGKVKNTHYMWIRERWKDDKFVINHELCHARGLVCD